MLVSSYFIVFLTIQLICRFECSRSVKGFAELKYPCACSLVEKVTFTWAFFFLSIASFVVGF